MFLGGIPRRPDKAEAYSQLKSHLTVLGVWIVVIRIVPFVLHVVTRESEQLELGIDD